MTKETMFCDRCGKELKGVWDNKGLHLYLRKFKLANVRNNDECLDLCQECYESLREWYDRCDMED